MVDMRRVTFSDRDGVYTVTGSGELDLHFVEPFKKALTDAVDSGDQIVVDLREASFIDSAYVMALIVPAKRMIERGGRLRILVIDGAYPQYVLRVVGFAELMEIVASQSEQ